MAISDEKYVSFTTFTKDGRPKPTPVWIADLGDGKIGFTTFSTSWKVKRLNNDPKVSVQPSDSRGTPTPGSTEQTGTAIAAQGAEFVRVRDVIKSKYGFQYTMIDMVGKVRKAIGKDSGTDTAIIITLDE